ncbi:hypothetical protein HMPREF0239_03903 [Clostridium sp. ATCC BAA-442]|nr:hypothetical protein HMPREF0239_03903 [Clostridium sp. ATCC BAA-442]
MINTPSVFCIHVYFHKQSPCQMRRTARNPRPTGDFCPPSPPIPPGCLVFFPHILYNSVQIMNRW